MKKISKKLTLNKKSVVRLNNDETKQVMGGGTLTCNTCPQYCNCGGTVTNCDYWGCMTDSHDDGSGDNC